MCTADAMPRTMTPAYCRMHECSSDSVSLPLAPQCHAVLEFGAHLRLMSNGGIITGCLDLCIVISRLVVVAAGCVPWSWSCAFTTLLDDWLVALVVVAHGLLSIAVTIKADKLMPTKVFLVPDLQVVV